MFIWFEVVKDQEFPTERSWPNPNKVDIPGDGDAIRGSADRRKTTTTSAFYIRKVKQEQKLSADAPGAFRSS